VGRMLLWLVLGRREHMHIAFTAILPHRDNCRSLDNFVVLEWVKVIFDIDWGIFLDGPCPKEGIRR
jgi:hypothetical protein